MIGPSLRPRLVFIYYATVRNESWPRGRVTVTARYCPSHGRIMPGLGLVRVRRVTAMIDVTSSNWSQCFKYAGRGRVVKGPPRPMSSIAAADKGRTMMMMT